jgi:glycerol kinase
MNRDLVLALDQGTTSSRSILFGRDGRPVAQAQREYPQLFPRPGEVEHDPADILGTQLGTAREALATAGGVDRVAAIGITNQRETTILWERDTGRPVANAIVWQSRVSAPICARLIRDGLAPLVEERTGLVIDAYFSATKIRHLFDTIPGLAARAERGEVLFGTVDTWLLWNLTGGRVHATDVSNASRTMLFDIRRLDWDDDLLRTLGVPRAMLPEVRDTAGDFGLTDPTLFGRSIPIRALAGDQQAATFGQACFEPGEAKNTYGTGCFLLLNTGEVAVRTRNRLLTTVGWRINGRTTYCLEGSVFIGGAVVQWLRDGLKSIRSSREVRELAGSVPDSGGVRFVPAFVGLGAPWWDPDARGAIFGITRDTTAAHIARAAVESIAWQSRDLLDAMRADLSAAEGTGPGDLRSLKVDGGATADDFLMQFQADTLGIEVVRPVVQETTALGAAYLAGLAEGVWGGLDDIRRNWKLDRTFQPAMEPAIRDHLHRDWLDAVRRCRTTV